MNYRLTNKETGTEIGWINETQLQFLIKELEEESRNDHDYWLHRSQLDIMREGGADEALLTMLEGAFGEGEELEITWEESRE